MRHRISDNRLSSAAMMSAIVLRVAFCIQFMSVVMMSVVRLSVVEPQQQQQLIIAKYSRQTREQDTKIGMPSTLDLLIKLCFV